MLGSYERFGVYGANFSSILRRKIFCRVFMAPGGTMGRLSTTQYTYLPNLPVNFGHRQRIIH